MVRAGLGAIHWQALAAILLLAFSAATTTHAQAPPPIDLAKARAYFAEDKAVSDKDAGRLWGVRPYGATFFVDPDGVRLEVTNWRRERRERAASWDAGAA